MSLTKYQFLSLAALLRHPMHPYAVRQEIIQLTLFKVWPSKTTVHKNLQKLQAAGYIQECLSDPHYWLKAHRGVPYEITNEGYWIIRKELAMYHLVFSKSWQRLAELDDRI